MLAASAGALGGREVRVTARVITVRFDTETSRFDDEELPNGVGLYDLTGNVWE